MSIQSEQALESQLMANLRKMGYEYAELKEEKNLKENLKEQLEKHNKDKLRQAGRTEFSDAEFEKIFTHLEGGSLFERAKKLRDLLPLDLDNGERIWVEFLDQKSWCKNEFQISNQITVEGRNKCRYDVTLLINGLPLVQIELKRRGMELKEAYNQIQRYQKSSYQGLFHYIQLFVISNGVNTRYFANNPNGGYKFTFNWTDEENHPYNDLKEFTAHFFDPCTLGKLLSKYVVMHEGDKMLMVLRPYQYYAVERILDRVANSNDNGYVWHTTGAGKTLTSFKAAQLVAERADVAKVLFVVDRHDLDTQTQSEYDAFERGAVDSTENTDELVRRLQSDSKIIITTIQKLNAAVSRTWYSKRIEETRHSKIVMIFDECHRSHFGDCHKNIMKFFDNAQIFGFTGTPIFKDNCVDGHTTKEIFGNCLHKYLIKDAIADNNVLGFLVEYYGSADNAQSPARLNTGMRGDRMRAIAEFILDNFPKSTFDGEYDALFAVQSVEDLVGYYKIFKSLKPQIKIGAIFTYASNPSQDDALTGMDTGSFVSESIGAADDLRDIIDDYNKMFGVNFSQENFRAYYDDINLRLKKKRDDMEPLDLCLVVGMFLTGFDSKKLNTLYVDKNMEYHGLLQAFSRTNRVLNDKKTFGKIVCFRNMKENVDNAIRLFSNANNVEEILHPPFTQVLKEYHDIATAFLKKYPTPARVDEIQDEGAKVGFVVSFRQLLKKHAEIQIYDEYVEDSPELGISEQQFMDYRSKYLDMYCAIGRGDDETGTAGDGETGGDDTDGGGDTPDIRGLDFCLELLHSDMVNVGYIISLIADLNPQSEDYPARRKDIIDKMTNDVEMRGKVKLIDNFIQTNVDEDRDNFLLTRVSADAKDALGERLQAFMAAEREKAIATLAQEEGVEAEALAEFISEYDFSQKENAEIIRKALADKHLGLRKARSVRKRILAKLRDIIGTYEWATTTGKQ